MNESKNVRKNVSMMLTGMVIGAALTGGSIAVAAGITAEPTWQPIFVDGQQVEMQAYNIAGHNYVKLRDIGKAVGFEPFRKRFVFLQKTSLSMAKIRKTLQITA